SPSQGERGSMWTCPKCRSEMDDSLRTCGACGTSSEAEEDPSCTRACKAGPSPDSPGSGWTTEPEDGFHEPPPEWVQCYWTNSRADAALMANHLESRGIIARPIQEPRALGSDAMYEVNGVLIRSKDLPRARRFLERIERRRARRQRPTEFPWDAFGVIGAFVLTIGLVTGLPIGAKIGEVMGWEQVCTGVGGGLG